MQNKEGMKKRTFSRILGSRALSAALFFPSLAAYAKPNVVLIAIEDFSAKRLECYGGPVKAPNIGGLAKEGVLFENAHVQVPICNPSRASLLLGRRPDTTKVYDNETDWRKKVPEGTVTMPEHFRKNGYHTAKIDKMFHKTFEDKASWAEDIPTHFAPAGIKVKPKVATPKKASKASKGVPLGWGPTGATPELDGDGQKAEQAVRFFKRKHDKPFLLGIGIFAPHLQFRAPEEFHAMYDPDTIKLPEVPRGDLENKPVKMDGDQKLLDEREQREVIAAHYACISYADWCVGHILKGLKETGLEDDTIVIVWSDHGFSLGEHYQWRKSELYDESTRVCFVWRVPGVVKKPGTRIGKPVEVIDTFPTLFDLCGIPPPEGVEGISMRKLLEDPSIEWKKGAITWRAGGGALSIQTERYRFNKQLEDGFLELYDRETDPGEFVNLAKKPEHQKTENELLRLLDGNWRACLPSWHEAGSSASTRSE